MRALWVNHHPEFGGPHNWATILRGALAERGWDTLALLPEEPGSAAERMRAGGMEVIQMPLHRARASADPRVNLRTARELRGEVRAIERLLAERSVDLVVVQALLNPHGAMAAQRTGAGVTWQVIDSRTPRPLRGPGMSMVRHYSDSVMFCGSALQDLHVGRRPLKVPAIDFTPVVDLALYRADPEHRRQARAEMGVPEDALFVGTVANLNPMKGIEYFVRAASLVFRERPDAHFLISGATHDTHRDYVERIEAEMTTSGVPADRWHRREGAPHGFYPALDVKVIASVPRSEGTTTTAMEAMAAGTPVVATDVGAVSEIVEDGVTGILVEPLDPGALAEAILRLAGDRDLWQSFSEAGRRRAEERYGIDAGAETHARAFAAALDGR